MSEPRYQPARKACDHIGACSCNTPPRETRVEAAHRITLDRLGERAVEVSDLRTKVGQYQAENKRLRAALREMYDHTDIPDDFWTAETNAMLDSIGATEAKS